MQVVTCIESAAKPAKAEIICKEIYCFELILIDLGYHLKRNKTNQIKYTHSRIRSTKLINKTAKHIWRDTVPTAMLTFRIGQDQLSIMLIES